MTNNEKQKPSPPPPPKPIPVEPEKAIKHESEKGKTRPLNMPVKIKKP